jgi:hypothetical protein
VETKENPYPVNPEAKGRKMKTGKFAMALGLWLGAAGLCPAQSEEETLDAELEKPREPIQAALLYRATDITDAHDALQHRADYSDDTRQHWQNGEVEGDGGTLTLSLRQGPSELTFRREEMEYDFKATEGANGQHEIGTQRDDWEIMYWHTKHGLDAVGETGARGWQTGIRYIGSEKDILIVEQSARLEQQGDVDWRLIQGGYWGLYRPMAWNARLFGALNFLFGEVEGLARSGNDDSYNGKISETYRNDQGLAYGMGLTIGAGIDFLKYFHINLGYRREWLYSFQATDSGVVVFPDNDDALFIENITMRYVEAGVSYRF